MQAIRVKVPYLHEPSSANGLSRGIHRYPDKVVVVGFLMRRFHVLDRQEPAAERPRVLKRGSPARSADVHLHELEQRRLGLACQLTRFLGDRRDL